MVPDFSGHKVVQYELDESLNYELRAFKQLRHFFGFISMDFSDEC